MKMLLLIVAGPAIGFIVGLIKEKDAVNRDERTGAAVMYALGFGVIWWAILAFAVGDWGTSD